jgi:hypothetical protein
VTCGAGTREVNGSCVPVADGGLGCGPGTVEMNGACLPVPVDGGVACGPGTMEMDGACVPGPADGGLTCGAGTVAMDGACVPLPADGGITCGQGTVDQNGMCVPVVGCGPGTVQMGDQCVTLDGGAGSYEVRVSITMLPGDGLSPIPVLLIGTRADGTAALDDVVVDVDRAGAGSFDRTAVTLGAEGTTVYFTPCNTATSPACAGPVQLVMYLASDTRNPVATSASILIEAPTGVGSTAPCMTGGNVVFFNGDSGDYIHPGMATITQGTFSTQGLGQTDAQNVGIHVVPSDSTQGLWWDLDFTSEMLGQPLQAQVYDNAERDPFESPGHPGMDVTGDGRGCNMSNGRFQIEELEMSGGSLMRFTATFEQHCEDGAAALRGCVHYEQ